MLKPKISSLEIKRISYRGSKNRIAQWIIETIIKTLNLQPLKEGEKRPFVDVFGGGGAMTTTVAEYYHDYFSEVIYNELDTGLSSLFEVLTNPSKKEEFEDLLKKLDTFVSRKEYKKLEKKSSSTAYEAAIHSMYSFSGDWRVYAYTPPVEPLKKEQFEIVIKAFRNSKKSFKKVRLEEMKTIRENFDRSKYPKMDEDKFRINQSLNNIQHLYNFQEFTPKIPIKVLNLSYEKIVLPKNSIVYLDPPYNSTEKYNKNKFNYDVFKEWAENLTLSAFLSEYDFESKNFEEIAVKEKITPLGSKGIKTLEKIYFNNQKGII